MQLNNNNTRIFKLYFPLGEIRRLATDASTWPAFRSKLAELYSGGLYRGPLLNVQYVDQDGDRCSVTSPEEWLALLLYFDGCKEIKLHITNEASASQPSDANATSQSAVDLDDEGTKKKTNTSLTDTDGTSKPDGQPQQQGEPNQPSIGISSSQGTDTKASATTTTSTSKSSSTSSSTTKQLKWEKELHILTEMGFDRSICAWRLIIRNGDIDKVINDLVKITEPNSSKS